MSFRPATLLARLQPLGRALMLPIAVLPIAALLLRLGQDDMLGIPFVAAAGDAIFSNLGLLFAAGVAVGLARENHGAASLAGVVAYLVATEGAKVLLHLPPDLLSAAAADQGLRKEGRFRDGSPPQAAFAAVGEDQGVDRLGRNLVVEATSPDGIIEGLRYNDDSQFIVGVQWHAEYAPDLHSLSGALYNAFGEAARKRAAKRIRIG